MHVVWNKPIRTSNPWEPNYFGVFREQKNEITYFFKDRTSLLALKSKDGIARNIYSCYPGEKLSLPREWVIVEYGETSFLLTSEDKGIDLRTNTFTNQIPFRVQSAYKGQVRHEKHYEEAVYSFNEYSITHKGNCGYICRKNGTQIWQFLGKAYLYTDIACWNNRIFFGTAGRSGYFYILDIESGKALASLKTGGTRCFVQIDNSCYVLSNSHQAQLLCIDLCNGTVLSRCNLPGKATVNSKLALIDGCIQAITFEFKNSELKGAVWSCIEI